VIRRLALGVALLAITSGCVAAADDGAPLDWTCPLICPQGESCGGTPAPELHTVTDGGAGEQRSITRPAPTSPKYEGAP
jgi:hypothetical protein